MMNPMVTVCDITKKATEKGEKINVFLVMNDMCYFKGEIRTKNDGGKFLQLSNSPWQKDGKWNNNYLAGFVSDDLKAKLEKFVLDVYASGKNYKDAANCKNYDMMQAKREAGKAGA